MWIITAEINDYNQEGEYFVAAYNEKPTFKQLKELLPNQNDVTIGKLTRGGGRQKYENEWYNLKEVKEGINYFHQK